MEKRSGYMTMFQSSPLEWAEKGRGRWECWHRGLVRFVLEFSNGLYSVEAHVWQAKVWSAAFKSRSQAEAAGAVIADAVYQKFG